MKIPFLDRFKKTNAPAQPVKRTAMPKTEGNRLSKTVMPNSTRAMAPADHAKTPSAVLTETAVVAPRAVSFSPKRAPSARPADLPPAVALALEPRVERVVALELAEIVRQMPAGLTKPAESFEAGRRVLLKAAELEKGMSTGSPTVSLGSIYQQVPEIFLHAIPATDSTEISLPFDKVLTAFSQMQVRRDQTREQAVPQVSTPFLQATLEDNERFGVATEPPTMAEEQPDLNVRVELATAKTLAAAEPEPSVSEKFVPAPADPLDEDEDESAESRAEEPPARSSSPAAKSPERIAFHFPPKETGASASERVPASCGPPVSNPLRPPNASARIPFAFPPSTTTAKDEIAPVAPPDERKISLPLKPILESLPVFQLTGDPKEVPDTAHIALSLALLQSQLPSGRIAIEPEIFERSLPPEGRRFFTAKDVDVPVILPLQEVLQKLPPDVLRMRDDQEEREQGETYVTPFSATAAEDAERFKKPPEPIAKMPDVAPAETPAPAPALPLDAKALVARANEIPEVRACALIFADGLNLAGHLPTEIASDGLCAVAPGLLERMAAHTLETKMGRLTAMTLHASKASITFFLQGNISLAALHATGELGAAARDQLSKMLEELSQTYSQQETSHVHH